MHSKTFILAITGLLLFTPLSVIVNSSLSESEAKEWEIVRQPRITHIYDIQFIDAKNGYAVMLDRDEILTHRTTIHRTFDGGITWTPQYWAKTYIGSLDFVDVNTGWAVGKDGAIIHTEDGGKTWKTQESGAKNGLVKVDFIDKNTGWIVGEFGVILHTEDGGATWSAQDSGFQQHLRSLSFVDEKNGWAVGDSGTILHTKDGGKRWERQSSGTDTTLFDVSFTNEKVGWAVGGGVIIHTEDSGATWNIQKNEDRMQGLRSICSIGKAGWVVGNFGIILHTSDGGKTWQTQKSNIPKTNPLMDVHFINQNEGWISSVNGNLLHTDDGGKNWRLRTSQFRPERLNAVHFVNKESGWVVGDRGMVFHTDDGGIVWKPQFGDTDEELFDVTFMNQRDGWAVGGLQKGVILATFDEGVTWTKQESRLEKLLQGVDFVNNEWPALNGAKGWIVARDGIQHTPDGKRWNLQLPGGEWYDVDFVSEKVGWAVGNAGIFRTRDGGMTWTRQLPAGGPLRVYYAVHFVDRQNGWAVGTNGVIVHTQDEGKTWKEQKSGISAHLYAVCFASTKEGWIAGGQGIKQGVILHTSDGGKNWQMQERIDGVILDICYDWHHTVWAVGEGGIILKYVDEAIKPLAGYAVEPLSKQNIVWSKIKAKADFSVPQETATFPNYPNPFNEETWIPFKLAVDVPMTIYIYGVRGQLVRKLELGQKPAGEYLMRENAAYWDGRNERGEAVASGLYFYRLSAGELTATRRMFVVK